jgi:hypothetical protein
MRGTRYIVGMLIAVMAISQVGFLWQPTSVSAAGGDRSDPLTPPNTVPSQCSSANNSNLADFPSFDLKSEVTANGNKLTVDFKYQPFSTGYSRFNFKVYRRYFTTDNVWNEYTEYKSVEDIYDYDHPHVDANPTFTFSAKTKTGGPDGDGKYTFADSTGQFVYTDKVGSGGGDGVVNNGSYQYTVRVTEFATIADVSGAGEQNSAWKSADQCKSTGVIKYVVADPDVPPCPTNFYIVNDGSGPGDDASADGLVLHWDYEWASKPADAVVEFRLSQDGSTSTPFYTTTWDGEKNVNVTVPPASLGSADTGKVVIVAVNTKTGKESGSCALSAAYVASTRGSRCGAVDALDIVGQITQAFCGFVAVFQELTNSFMKASFFFLVKTAGLPQGAKIDDNNIFSWIAGTAVTGQVQDNLVSTGGAGESVRIAYNRILSIVNSLAVLGLIIIALASILQIQLNTYSIKKLLPGLVIGVLLANASFFIVRAGLELSGNLANGLMHIKYTTTTDASGNTTSTQSVDELNSIKTKDGKPVDSSTMFENFAGFGNGICTPPDVPCGIDGRIVLTEHGTKTEPPDISKIFQQFFLTIFAFIAAVMVFILAFLFMVRSLIFYFAVPLAPIAFLGLFVPPLQFAWSRWSKLVINWIFMPVVAFFWLWLAFQWFSAATFKSGFFAYMMNYAFGLFAVYLAMKTPSSMAGEAKMVLDKWGQGGKWAFKNSTQWAADEAKLQGTKSNFLGIQGFKTILAGKDERFKERMKNAEAAYASRDNGGNLARQKKMNRIKQEAEGQNNTRERIDAKAKMEDPQYMEAQEALEHYKEITGKLSDVIKDEIEARRKGNLAFQEQFIDVEKNATFAHERAQLAEEGRKREIVNQIKKDPHYIEAQAQLKHTAEVTSKLEDTVNQEIEISRDRNAGYIGEQNAVESENIIAKGQAALANLERADSYNNFISDDVRRAQLLTDSAPETKKLMAAKAGEKFRRNVANEAADIDTVDTLVARFKAGGRDTDDIAQLRRRAAHLAANRHLDRDQRRHYAALANDAQNFLTPTPGIAAHGTIGAALVHDDAKKVGKALTAVNGAVYRGARNAYSGEIKDKAALAKDAEDIRNIWADPNDSADNARQLGLILRGDGDTIYATDPTTGAKMGVSDEALQYAYAMAASLNSSKAPAPEDSAQYLALINQVATTDIKVAAAASGVSISVSLKRPGGSGASVRTFNGLADIFAAINATTDTGEQGKIMKALIKTNEAKVLRLDAVTAAKANLLGAR